MEKIDLRQLEKKIDDYFDNLTEVQFIENMKNIYEELEKDTIFGELQSGNNVIIPIRKRKKKTR